MAPGAGVRAGKMLAGMEKHDGNPRSHDVTRLSDMGINKKQSSRWQLLATIPDETLEERTSSNRRIALFHPPVVSRLTPYRVVRHETRLRLVSRCLMRQR